MKKFALALVAALAFVGLAQAGHGFAVGTCHVGVGYGTCGTGLGYGVGYGAGYGYPVQIGLPVYSLGYPLTGYSLPGYGYNLGYGAGYGYGYGQNYGANYGTPQSTTTTVTTTSYAPPAQASYQAPQYQAPAPQYQAPAPTYSLPPPIYSAPNYLLAFAAPPIYYAANTCNCYGFARPFGVGYGTCGNNALVGFNRGFNGAVGFRRR
jgi:hypothetical protein